MKDSLAAEQVKEAIEADKTEVVNKQCVFVDKTEVVKKKPAKSFEEIEKRIEEAKSYAERIEKANIHAEDILQRQEVLRGKDILGGRTEAGITVKEETSEEKKKREINEYLKSTGFKIQ